MRPSNSKLLAKIQGEVERSVGPNGTILVNTLVGMPYLNSAFNETLRVYVDMLLTRTLDEDLTLDEYHMPEGGIIIAPSFLGHRHPTAWSNDNQPHESVWYGERFIKIDDKSGEATFSTAGTSGRFFPFGGGVYACPGRVFAKQEVFGAIATFLLEFEVQFVEYLRFDKKGNPIRRGLEELEFPVVKKQFCGSGVVLSEGDMLVQLKRRKEGR
jgi:cytochrome P450